MQAAKAQYEHALQQHNTTTEQSIYRISVTQSSLDEQLKELRILTRDPLDSNSEPDASSTSSCPSPTVRPVATGLPPQPQTSAHSASTAPRDNPKGARDQTTDKHVSAKSHTSRTTTPPHSDSLDISSVSTLAGVPLYGFVQDPDTLLTYAYQAKRLSFPVTDHALHILTWFFRNSSRQ